MAIFSLQISLYICANSMKAALTILHIIIVAIGYSQTNLWQEYLPYKAVRQVVKNDDVIYAHTGYSIFTYNTSDNSIERLSKVNRLNDFGISYIAYNTSAQKLVVGYRNGNIDFVSSNQTEGQPAIKNAFILGDKTIYHLHNEGKIVYVSTGFGIVVMDATNNEVLDNYIIGDSGEQLKVNAITTDNTFIYAATDKGIKKAPKNSSFLTSFTLWERDNTITDPTLPKHHILSYKGKFIVTVKDDLDANPDEIYYYDGATWNMFPDLLDQKIQSITENGTHLVITTKEGVWIYDENFNEVRQSDNKILYWSILDNENTTLWMAHDFNRGLIKETPTSSQDIFPESPLFRDVFAISDIIDNKFWAVAGGVTAGKGFPTFNPGGSWFYDGNKWKTYSKAFYPEFNVPASNDYVKIGVNPKNLKHAATSNYLEGGLFEINDNIIVRHYTANSTLKQDPLTNRYHLEGVKFDDDENIWVINSYTNAPLNVKTPSGEWKAFAFDGSNITNRYSHLLIDSRGYKWMVSPSGGGVIVFDDNNTPIDATDDKFKVLTTDVGKGDLPTRDVWSIAEDLTGLIWIGTSEGLAVFFNPQGMFETTDDAKQILIEQDGNVEILLGAEKVTAIEIDGANRKWIGTENSGVFVFSPEGYEQIHHFTVDNSPLFSNTINDIKIDQELGIVYIATMEGMLSYKTDATAPNPDFIDVYAYPNPVRENYEGNIYINGLMLNSNCKITDIEGNLVAEVQSLGGQAVWDGRDKFGNRVKTGVYLVFLANADGSKTEVTKIMVVR
jgi:hypothetical protein